MSVVLKGVDLDAQGRCKHYRLQVDVVCIAYKCCEGFYACYECHRELTDHKPKRYETSEFDQHAVVCGCCRKTLSIREYVATNQCPYCFANWNPKCASHYHFYFDFGE